MGRMTWPTPETADLLAKLTAGVDEVLPQALLLRRDLHRHPDLGGAEQPTADRVQRAMPGIAPVRVADTGFLVRTGPDAGPAVALRAELDALPVVEQTGVDWAATNGAMHACGHDVHLAAAWAVHQAAGRLDLPTGLVTVFQPREEVQPSGGEDVVASGILAEQDVRAMIGVHVQPRVPAGVVSTGNGGVNAAADEFDIIVHGQPGHGAYPHITIDPIPVLAAIILGLQELIGRTIDPIRPALITVGEVRAGATHNIIPASGSLHGIIRTMHDDDQQHLHAAIKRLADHTARARGARAEVRIVTGDPVLANDARLVQLVDPLLVDTGMLLAHEPFRSLGADDFAHYAKLAPSLMAFVGTGPGTAPDSRYEVGLHHPRYLPGDDAVRRSALAFAAGYLGGAHLAGAL